MIVSLGSIFGRKRFPLGRIGFVFQSKEESTYSKEG